MATRAILRGKRTLFSSSSYPRFLIHSYTSSEDRSLPPAPEPSSFSWDLRHPSANTDLKKEISKLREYGDRFGLLQLGRSFPYRLLSRSTEYALSFGLTGTRQHVQHKLYSSAATSGQSPERDSSDQIEEARKEPSPEECDQAVEGLSSAKAKAKKIQESQKVEKPVLQNHFRLRGKGSNLWQL